MNYLNFILQSAYDDLRRNKIRTFLTSLGILIGVAAVVLILAFGLGLKVFITSQFQGLGTNLIFVLPGRVLSQGGGGFRPGAGTIGGTRFDEKDVLSLKRIEGIEYVVPYSVKTVRVQSKGKSEIADIRGTTEDDSVISHVEMDQGIFFDRKDVEKKSKIAVLGQTIAEKLFQSSELGLGKTIRIENHRLKVIGILKKKGDLSHNSDSSIFIPYTSAFVFSQDKKFFDIHIQLRDYKEIDKVKEKIKQTLLKRYKEDDFSVVEQTEILGTIGSILNAVSLLLVALGAISLVVGGVGIMNIMYVSVTERRKEIGIRRAIGATSQDILLHFLVESVLLSLFGGLIGLGLAFIIVFFIQKFFPAYIDLNSIMLALGVSSLIGIVFGVFPAKKAADLSPIDAIRYE